MRAFLLHHVCIHVQPDYNSQIYQRDRPSQVDANQRWTHEYQPDIVRRGINNLLDCFRDVSLLPRCVRYVD